MSKKRLLAKVLWIAASCWLAQPVTAPWAADDPGTRTREQHQLQRQQQEDALQLRMRQQQRATRAAPADAREKRAIEQLHAGQRERQQSLHDRQSIEPSPAVPGDGAGTQRAKAELERMKAQQESQRQLQRLESEQPAR